MFVKEQASHPLETFQKLNDSSWMYRINIKKLPENLWEADSKVVSNKEKEMIEATVSGTAESTSNLDDNDTIVMEALADIYEQLAVIKEQING